MKIKSDRNDTEVEVDLVDGIWPETGAYIDVIVEGDIDNGFSIPLAAMIESRLRIGFNPDDFPPKGKSAELAELLRRYADYLEANCVNSAEAYAEADGVAELRQKAAK